MPELVPGPLWGHGASQMLKNKAAWKRIRQDALSQSNGFCVKCGGTNGQLSCHDKWEYDDASSIATLVGFEIHCSSCDSVAHAGRAIHLGYGEEVINHLCEMNGWKPQQAMDVLKKAMDVWIERNKKAWTVAVTPTLVERYPQLIGLPEFKSLQQ